MLVRMLQVEGKCTSTKDTAPPQPSRTATCGSTAPVGGGPGRMLLVPAVVANLPVPTLANTEPLQELSPASPHARAVALHARRTATLRTPTIRTLRTPTLRLRRPRHPSSPPRDPHRYAKPLLHLFAATTTLTLHVPTTCALQRLRAAVAFVFLRQTDFVGVAGKLIAPQLPLAVAQRAAPSFPIAAGMKTLAPARAMPFRSQGMTSTAALRPLMFFLLPSPLVTPLVLGAVARGRRACRRGLSP